MSDGMSQFKVGAKVRMKPEAVARMFQRDRLKLDRGRVGVVMTHTYPNLFPVVSFPAVGRRKEYGITIFSADEWEVVEEKS